MVLHTSEVVLILYRLSQNMSQNMSEILVSAKITFVNLSLSRISAETKILDLSKISAETFRESGPRS